MCIRDRPDERADHAVLPGQARGEGEPAQAAFEGSQALLQGGTGGVGRAGVFIASAQPADAVLLEGRHLVDRGHHSAGGLVSLLPGVDGGRREASGALRGHDERL